MDIVAAVDYAGIKRQRTLHMVNTNMHEFKHPNYYKELRSIRNKLDQVISKSERDGESERAPGPGLKPQASSSKPQASTKLVNACIDQREPQAPSSKLQKNI